MSNVAAPTVMTREQILADATALMTKVRMHVATYHNFYGALQARLRLKADWRCKTMYTDAVVLGFNPAFTLKRTWNELIYIVAHEVTHCALKHSFRRGIRNPKLYNKAADHVVNLTLNRDPEMKAITPVGALCDERFAPNGVIMSVGEVYAILLREKEQRDEEERRKWEEEQKQREQQEEQCDDGAAGGNDDSDSDGDDDESGDDDADDEGDDADDDSQIAGASDDEDSWGDVVDAGASGEPLPDFDDEEEEDDEDEDDAYGDDDDLRDDESDDDDDRRDASDGDDTDDTDDDDTDNGTQQNESTHEANDEAALERLSREWDEAVITAELAAGGEMDSAMKRALGEAQEQHKDFRQYVDEFAANCTMVETSWNRPARRFVDYLPSPSAPGIKSMVFAIDTSASINDNDLRLMELTAQRIMEQFNLYSVVVIYCDDAVRGVERFVNGEQVSLENAKGGGGTAFHPVFRRVLELQDEEEIAGVVYMSDLDGEFSDVEDFTHIPTLWVKTDHWGKDKAPGGLGTVCKLFE